MALPTMRVRVGFNQDTFELDDPVRGVLNTSKLGGTTTFTDVTNKVLSLSVDRGRSRDINAFQAGSCNFELDNLDARYDPTNSSGAYYGGIEPLMEVIVDATTDSGTTYYPLFTGFVTDWNINYPNSADSTVSVACSDAFMKLANTALTSTSVSSALTGAFITEILDEPTVKFSPDRSIETGNSTMASQTISANTLNAIQTAEFSEQGAVFIAKDGTFTFKQRHSTFPSTSSATFSDDGSDLSYTRMDQTLADELLYNYVSMQRNSGTAQVSENSASQSKFLLRELTKTGLYNNSDTDVKDISNHILAKYDEVEPRFNKVNVDINDLSTAQQVTVLDLEVIDIIKVEITPVGTSSQVSRYSIIDGISWSVTPSTQTVVFSTSDTTDAQFLRLNSSLFGVLDTDKLGY